MPKINTAINGCVSRSLNFLTAPVNRCFLWHQVVDQVITMQVKFFEDYERTAEELRFVKAVAQGLVDVREGNTLSLEDARKALGIK